MDDEDRKNRKDENRTLRKKGIHVVCGKNRNELRTENNSFNSNDSIFSASNVETTMDFLKGLFGKKNSVNATTSVNAAPTPAPIGGRRSRRKNNRRKNQSRKNRRQNRK